jgi:hypothetical protein
MLVPSSYVPTLTTSATRAATILSEPIADLVAGTRHIQTNWTPTGYVVGTQQYIWSTYVDSANFTAVWYNGVIVAMEKKVAGVSEFVTFPLVATLGTTYKIDGYINADNTLQLKVNDVAAQSGLGSEFITVAANRDFSSDTGFWTKAANVSITGGQVTWSGASNDESLLKLSYIPGFKPYQLGHEIKSISGGTGFRVRNESSSGPTRNTPGVYSDTLLNNLNVGFFAISNVGAGFTGSIDNVSLKEVYNNSSTIPCQIGSTIQIGSMNGVSQVQGYLSNYKILKR